MFAALPLLALPVGLYALIALTLDDGGLKSFGAQVRFAQPLFDVHMASGVSWPVSLGDLIVAASLTVLFIELLKSTSSRRVAIINHSLSMILFIVCLVAFLLFPAFATTTFFMVALMVLLDVLAGFIVTIASARRDIDFTD